MFYTLKLENSIDFLNIYDGGSIYGGKSNQLPMTRNNVSSQVKSNGSQVFLEFTTDGTGVGKGFSASIKFGIRNYACDIRAYHYYIYGNAYMYSLFQYFLLFALKIIHRYTLN